MAESLTSRLFTSRTMNEHWKRGAMAIALGMVAAEVHHLVGGYVGGAATVALIGGAVWAARGCPVCWTVGLIETARGRGRAAAS